MPTFIPKQEKNFVLQPAGTHIARCVGMIQLGTQEIEWLGVQKFLPKIRLTWELPEELHVFKEGEDAKPFVISQEYTLSMADKSKLRPVVEGLMGKLTEAETEKFDIETLLGKCCLLTIVHNSSKSDSTKIFANVSTTAPLMKGMTCKSAYNPIQLFTFENWDQKVFDSFPEFIKDKIRASVEYPKLFPSRKTSPGTDGEVVDVSDIPF